MTTPWPRRGEVWVIQIPGETKRRPCVILSTDWLNQYAHDITVIPITSVMHGQFPTRVELVAGAGGLKRRSWVKCDQVTTIRKLHLVGNPFGLFSSAKMTEIAAAVRQALDL
jgi:mRNA interferase MazF